MITLQNFTIGFGERQLLKGVNANVKCSCLTALIGRNGSGKSTLLRAIAGLNHNYTGNILLDSDNIRQTPPQKLARKMAFVSTERTRIANLTCAQLVGLGRAPYTNWIGRLSKVDTDVVDHALESVGMTAYANRTLNTMSDGECQRVMVARALAQDTPIILLDEPTSFLDLPNRYSLCNLLGDIAHRLNKCILFSTHELDIALRTCDNIAIIDSPNLQIMPSAQTRASGIINRLFGDVI
ncbi:MAG: ABC transporter ATP-binding protein [Muribaculum sp.]|nr:ABC transporter ATP-binding protein [Muribaculaceae bacterium]MCM1080448.1 ABC transporter ATP-binding protein [Muribaculum sp.]